MAVRRKHIRALVNQILKDHKITTAPVPIEDIAIASGGQVRYAPAEDNLSGFLLRDIRQSKAVIGVNSNHSDVRKRFTIAHELGHLLLHEGERMHVDHRYQINLRDVESSKGNKLEEKEANLFAAELLMPAHFIKKDLVRLDSLDFFDDEDLQQLADDYGVSTQALTFRLAYLGYLEL